MRNGIKFDQRFVLMANEYDMETKSNDIDQDQQSQVKVSVTFQNKNILKK